MGMLLFHDTVLRSDLLNAEDKIIILLSIYVMD